MLPEKALNVFDSDEENLQSNHTAVLKIKEEEKAPDFSLLNAIDKTVKLSELLKEGKFVLIFL